MHHGADFFLYELYFQPTCGCTWNINFSPFFTLCVELGLFSVYTRTEEKSEEGKRVTGPHILAVHGSLLPFPLIHHCPPQKLIYFPWDSMIFLGNSPFREPIVRSLCSTEQFCQNFPVDRDFLFTQILFTVFRPCGEYVHSFWWGWGELGRSLHLMCFSAESHKICILHSLTMSHYPFPALPQDSLGRSASPRENSQRSLGNGPFHPSFWQRGFVLTCLLWDNHFQVLVSPMD